MLTECHNFFGVDVNSQAQNRRGLINRGKSIVIGRGRVRVLILI